MKTTELLKEPTERVEIQTTVDRYSKRFDGNESGTEERLKNAATLNIEYYSLVTDFYLHGWGRMFHFGMRKKGETLQTSLLRHEMFLAEKLELKGSEKCLDIGCGVGGPMINFAKKTGASITGINNSAYQIGKARQFIKEQGLNRNCSFIECDWMEIPLESEGFNKAYAIESTCHAAENRDKVFREINRLLKPGALFASYDWVMKESYNPDSPEHRDIKQKIEIGNGLSNLNYAKDVTNALEKAGFKVLECRDVASECDPETPWYLPLQGAGYSLTSLRTSPAGRFFMRNLLRIFETFRIVPKGTTEVHKVLEMAADGLVRGGEQGIFTPMLFFLAKKV